MAIEKILFPTKFEELGLVVVHQVMALQKAGLKEIVFLHVIDRDEVSFDRAVGFNQELADKMRAEAESRFADWEKNLGSTQVTLTHRIEVGEPTAKILEATRELQPDLVVAGRQHETPMDRVYLGGTSMNVIRNSPKPVFVTKPVLDEKDSDERVHNPFQRVLLATDFSAPSKTAQDLVSQMGASIDEVDVVNVLNERDDDPSDDQAALDAIAKHLSGAGVIRTHLLRGTPTQEILRLARDNDSTCIVMGTTGKHGIKEMFLGSVSHRVAECSDTPVILVPASS